MWKVKISTEGDAVEVKIRGNWLLRIFRDELGTNTHYSIEKGIVRYELYQEDDKVILEKYVDNQFIETKKYRSDGVENCEGTVFLNDHSNPKRCYAFWRSKELLNLIDSVGAKRLLFAKSLTELFDYEVEKNCEGYDFVTDGKVTYQSDTNTYQIFGASYVYRPVAAELILSPIYNIEYVTSNILRDMAEIYE